MAKIIKMNETEIDRLKEEFAEALRKMKLADGKINFQKDFGKIERKAKLVFTEIAWLKQSLLVNEFDKEVAWHGVAKRGEEEYEYIIEDILVYPQEVTGSTVNTDQERYQDWLYQNPDEIFNNIRMQGHSHVNMGVSPSSVDTTLYEKFLNQLDDTMFYIFLIFNKKGDHMAKIYDMQANVLFETADVDIEVMDEGFGFGKFIDDANEMVKTKAYQYNGYANKSAPAGTTKAAPTSAATTTKPSEESMKKGKKKQNTYYENWPKRYDDDRYYDRWR